MARDWIEIGSTPSDEDCVQVSREGDYLPAMRRECRAFAHQLLRQFAPIPEGADIGIKSNPHDFGTYLEVVAYFDDSYPESVEWAFGIEANTPAEWDNEARQELGI